MKDKAYSVSKYLDILKSTIFDFDDEKKKQFISDNIDDSIKSDRTFHFNLSVLKFIASNEAMVDLPIGKMSSGAIDTMLYSLCSNSIYSLSSYVSIIRKYLMQTSNTTEIIEIGYMYIMGLKRKDLEKFIDKEARVKKYFTPKIIDDFVNTVVNSSNKEYDYNTMTVIVMIWLGLTLDEIRNLKKHDIVIQDNQVVIKTGRQEYMSKYFDLFFLASTQTAYKMTDKQEIIDVQYNEESEFFVNAGVVAKMRSGNAPIGEQNLKKRIVNLAYQLKNKHLNVSNLTRSKVAYNMLEYFNFNYPTYTECLDYVEENELKTNPEFIRRGAAILLNKLEEEKNK